MTTITDNIQSIRTRIINAANQYSRQNDKIELLAVTKTKPVSAIKEAISAGQTHFGENYVQEGIEKIQYINQLFPKQPIKWHLIGHLQSNKTRIVAEYFDWVQTIDNIKIAKRLHAQRPIKLGKLNVLIQINISQETTKSGINPSSLMSLAEQISSLSNFSLRGLMAIPSADPLKQIEQFTLMTSLFTQLKAKYPATVDTLSMGMSDDLELAIKCGSSMVRIGSAIFGARTNPV